MFLTILVFSVPNFLKFLKSRILFYFKIFYPSGNSSSYSILDLRLQIGLVASLTFRTRICNRGLRSH